MKKLTYLLVFVLVLSCLCVGAAAQETPWVQEPYSEDLTIEISEDYKTVTWQGVTYCRFNSNVIELDYEGEGWEAALTAQQLENLSLVYVESMNRQTVLNLQIYFRDSSTLIASYLREDMIKVYENLQAGNAEKYRVDFGWPEGNTVNADRQGLYGTSMTLTEDILSWCNSYDVYAVDRDESIAVIVGFLLSYEEKFYYVDFSQARISYDAYGIDLYEYQQLPGWEITDEALLQELNTAQDAYYNDDMGFLFNDALTQSISKIFLVVIFCVIPGIVLILFAILAIRAKQAIYRKLFIIVSTLSGTLTAIFTLVLCLLW